MYGSRSKHSTVGRRQKLTRTVLQGLRCVRWSKFDIVATPYEREQNAVGNSYFKEIDIIDRFNHETNTLDDATCMTICPGDIIKIDTHPEQPFLVYYIMGMPQCVDSAYVGSPRVSHRVWVGLRS